MSTDIDSHANMYEAGCVTTGNPGGISASPVKVIGGELMSWSIMEIIGSGPPDLDRPDRCESELDTRSSPGGSTVIGHVSGLPDNSVGISVASPTLAVLEILGVLVRRWTCPGSTSTDVLFLSRDVRRCDDVCAGESAVYEMVTDSSTWIISS